MEKKNTTPNNNNNNSGIDNQNTCRKNRALEKRLPRVEFETELLTIWTEGKIVIIGPSDGPMESNKKLPRLKCSEFNKFLVRAVALPRVFLESSNVPWTFKLHSQSVVGKKRKSSGDAGKCQP